MDDTLDEDANIELDVEFALEYKENLERFAKFCCLVYVPYFMSSSFGADSPLNDLNLFKLLHDYQLIDSELSFAALPPFAIFPMHLVHFRGMFPTNLSSHSKLCSESLSCQ